MRIFLIVISFFIASSLYAQLAPSNLRHKFIIASKDTLQLDSLSIVPNSLNIKYDTSYYFFNVEKAIFVFKKLPKEDSVEIFYRVFPLHFTKNYFHKNIGITKENEFTMSPFVYSATDVQNKGSFADFGDIDYAGTFGRNLAFGNQQNVTLNSQFNMQLEGELGDSIKIRGAITDNTIPFQPEGNTQQIQEFDKVSLEFERKNSKLIMGDHELKKPQGYFMNFYKRVQGGLFETKTIGKKMQNTMRFGGSFAKGKWVRKQITPIEGNQGPYKIVGPNGETFFIILAGTERVYIDGNLLERGEDKDYIIDYNTTELVFMPRKLITKDQRIFVEFEFADRNYLNSLIYFSDALQVNKKLQVRFNIYANQDAKNQPIQADIDSSEKRFLRDVVGNNFTEAFYPAVHTVDTFSADRILYKKIDTTINAILYKNIYVYNTHPDSAKYSLQFSYVGAGKGNYVQSTNSANGRVYRWIVPVNNSPSGDYEPIILLVTPKSQQLITTGLQYQIDSNKSLLLETAFSHFDPNTFSALGNNDNIGLAQKIVYNEKRNLPKNWTILSELNYEFLQQNFKPIERFRNVEFVRDWNLGNSDSAALEHLGKASILLEKNNKLGFGYMYGKFLRGDYFNGTQHIPNFYMKEKNFSLKANGNFIHQRNALADITFLRPQIDFEKTFEKLQNWTIGGKYLKEHNDYRIANTDSLSPLAFSFNEYRLWLRNPTEKKEHVDIAYFYRDDAFRKENQFSKANYSHNVQLNAQILSLKNQNIQITTTYRQMKVLDSLISPQKDDESALGRVEYNYQFAHGMLSGNSLYELGSGQEQKREFTYVEVAAGQGLYVWRDYNGDGIKQLNEFEIANFPDEKRFIKIFTPTNQYVKVKYTQFTNAFVFNPKAHWKSTDLKGIKKAVSYFYFLSSIQMANRLLSKNGLSQFNPLYLAQSEDELLQNNTSVVNSIFFNRFNNRWGVDFIHSFQTNKSLMNYGVDGRENNEFAIKSRWNMKKNISFQFQTKNGYRSFHSPFLDGRNYGIQFYAIEPVFTWLLKNNQFRTSLSYKYDERRNEIFYGGENAFSNSGLLEIKYNILNSGTVGGKILYNAIKYNGNENSSVSYTMLDGLKKGNNFLWQLNLDKKVSKNIEMNISYEGRKPGKSPVVHTGRAGVRAIF